MPGSGEVDRINSLNESNAFTGEPSSSSAAQPIMGPDESHCLNGEGWRESQHDLDAAQRSLSSALSLGSNGGSGGQLPEISADTITSSSHTEALQAPQKVPAEWLHHPKHFLILSSSGKPIYSFHQGDEGALSSLTALISALVSVVHVQVCS